MIWSLILLLAVIAVAAGLADPVTQGVFTNPVVRYGQDPWVIRWNSAYYFCQSRNEGSESTGVWVNVATNLEDIGKDHWQRVWHPKPGTLHSQEIWAPELHYLQGKWYIYVAADNGDNSDHRMYVLEGTSQDPQKPFVLKGKIAAPSDRWAIDGTVLEMPDGKLYFIWSGWKGGENIAQDLYIAPMSDPWTISGKRVCISRPEYPWEKDGMPINEGPETLWNGSHLFVIYSASPFWMHYCLGQLTWNGGDVLDPKSWVKKSVPVFSGTSKVFGPGHCSFVKSPDGKEDWIVYHALISADSNGARNVRIQRFTWNGDGSPDFGVPVAAGVPLERPSGEH